MNGIMKRICSVIISAAIFCSMGLTIYATDKEKTPEELAEEQAAADVYAQPVDSNAIANWPQGPAIYGESGIVMDMKSGAILYAKKMDDQHFPASITKIMTSLIALENSELTDKVTFTEDSISFLEYGDAHIGMKPGEELTMEQALYAVLLASANEVSHAVAENAGGLGYDKFIATMNERAKELGCLNTNFVNANGLHDEKHYTSARDMALMGSELFKHEEIKTIMQTLQYTIPATNITAEERVFQQNHKMLYPQNSRYYENCVGGKTGFTNESLTTLITFSDNKDMQLVAVNLKTHGANVYPDTRNMFDYVYSNFKKVLIKENEKSDDIDKLEDDTAYVVLPESVTFADLKSTLVESGDKKDRQATLAYTYQNQPVGSTKVTLSNAYYKKHGVEVEKTTEKDTKDTEKANSTMPLRMKIIIGAGVAVLLFLIYFSFAYRRYKKRMKKRKHRERAHRRNR